MGGKMAVLAAWILLDLSGLVLAQDQANTRPNIVLIVIDDLGKS